MNDLKFVETDCTSDMAFLKFAKELKQSILISSQNNGNLDGFKWLGNDSLIPKFHRKRHSIDIGLKDYELSWLHNHIEFEYLNISHFNKVKNALANYSAFDFIKHRFEFMPREEGHESRTKLTKKEMLCIQIQTEEFLKAFQKQTCDCEIRMASQWLIRVINLILDRNNISDQDFDKIDRIFEYYKSYPMDDCVDMLHEISKYPECYYHMAERLFL